MKIASMRTSMISAVLLAAVGCASNPSESIDTGASDLVRSSSTMESKTIEATAVSKVEGVGQNFNSYVTAQTSGLKKLAPESTAGCAETSFSNSSNDVVATMTQCTGSAGSVSYSVFRSSAGAFVAWKSGNISYVELSDGTSADDANDDGKVDWISEPIKNLKEFVVEGYDPACEVPARVANRVLEDTDFDGSFDKESVTSALDSSWNCVGNQ